MTDDWANTWSSDPGPYSSGWPTMYASAVQAYRVSARILLALLIDAGVTPNDAANLLQDLANTEIAMREQPA